MSSHGIPMCTLFKPMKSDEEWSIRTGIHLILQIHLWGSRHHIVVAGDGRRLRCRGDRWGGGVSVLLLRCGHGWEIDGWLLLLLLRADGWLVVHYVTHGGHQLGLVLLKDTEAQKTPRWNTNTNKQGLKGFLLILLENQKPETSFSTKTTD